MVRHVLWAEQWDDVGLLRRQGLQREEHGVNVQQQGLVKQQRHRGRGAESEILCCEESGEAREKREQAAYEKVIEGGERRRRQLHIEYSQRHARLRFDREEQQG